MALEIDMARVSGVLLADGWHYIHPGSFRIEDFLFASGEEANRTATPSSIGFTFAKVDQITRAVQLYAGPLSSLLAIRHEQLTEVVQDE